jgi:hypothetical protein
MRRVWIDFNQPVPKLWLITRRIALMLGLLAVIAVSYMERHIAHEIEALEWRSKDSSRDDFSKIPTANKSHGQEISGDARVQIKRVKNQISLPWPDLFAVLEQSLIPGISILAITPDSGKSSLIIKATAKDIDTIIDYLHRLRASKSLDSVHLVSQEILNDESSYPVLFVVDASWRVGL